MSKAKPLKGEVTIPGDKSISHRAVMIGSLSTGTSTVNNFLQGEDCIATINAFRQMGIDIENNSKDKKVTIHGKGPFGLSKPCKEIDVGNSGTTIRILSGILCGQTFDSIVTGDASIKARPMNRIINPLTKMAGKIKSISNDGLPPLKITSRGNSFLQEITYNSPVASAQVKSAILMAGLYADGKTKVIEPTLSRNHTELMLKHFGAKISQEGSTTTLEAGPKLVGQNVNIPGDISSAAYFIVAGLIVPGSSILIKNVGINPTRDGIIEVCKNMGGKVSLKNIRYSNMERMADVYVEYSVLKGIEIAGPIIPRLIDELPIIAVMACFAKGETIIKDAQELMVKETNRIEVMVNNLSKLGANITATSDGMIIEGEKTLHANTIDSMGDHRIAMSFAIADLMTKDKIKILGNECVNISYPDFFKDLNSLTT